MTPADIDINGDGPHPVGRPLDAAGRPPLPGQTMVPGAVAVAVGEVVDTDRLEHRAFDVAERQASPATRRTYRSAYRSLSAFLGAGAGADALTPAAVSQYRHALERAGKAPRTVAVYLSAVRLLADELGSDPGVRRVKSERVQPGEPKALEPHELEGLLKMPDLRTTRGVRDHAVLQLLSGAGLRRAEVANLEFTAIEERRRLPDPRHRQAVGNATAFAVRLRSKRGRERIVPLAADVVAALAAWRDRRPPAATGRLFVTLPTIKGRTSGPLDPRDVARIAAKHAAAAGLPADRHGAHVLRHTFATNLRRNGAAIDTIRDLLGHEDIRTTQVYARVDHAELEHAVDGLTRAPSALERL